MLIKAKSLTGYKLNSSDGEMGKVKEFYFDDQHWTIRYLVVDTGGWLTDRQVLISPYALREVNENEQHIDVALTKAQIESSPSWERNKPVSRQFEESYYGYYGWPMYWGGPHIWGHTPTLIRDYQQWKEPTQTEKVWDHHLRSTDNVRGNHIQASDGEIGHVDDFIIDDETWAIRYLVVSTRNWWPGKKVLVSPQWIKQVNWDESKVYINHSREAIKESPEYTEESLLTRDYEIGLHNHYHAFGYWVDEAAAAKLSKRKRSAQR